MSGPDKKRGHEDNNESRVQVRGAIEAYPPKSFTDQRAAERKEDAATHVTERKEDRVTETKKLLIEGFTLAAVVFYAFIAALQWYEMHKALVIDQRAWINVPFPTTFPLDGPFIPATIQITNTGRTPAKNVEINIVATVLNKGDKPDLSHFGPGRAYNKVIAGAIFANAPITMTIPVVHYGPFQSENIVPDDTLRQDIANGKRFISLYGRVDYWDVLGVKHWTQFCTGYGPAISDGLIDCIRYNDVDTNEK